MVNCNVERFLSMETRDDLASYLNISLATLTMFAYSDKDFYRHFSIKKSNGSARKIDAPTGKLKYMQRTLADVLYQIYKPPISVHGFQPDRSIATNASCHTGHQVLLNIDLEDFFPSIGANRVYGLFTHKPFLFENTLAHTLTQLVCYGGCLPQGAPTSPVISNMICLSLDLALIGYAKGKRLCYTRYADDIVISSVSKRTMRATYDNQKPEKDALSSDIRKIIEKNGFAINWDKVHVSFSGERQTVTGIIVNQKCNYPRQEYRALRTMFHKWEKEDWQKAAHEYIRRDPKRGAYIVDDEGMPIEALFRNHIRGRLNFYTMIDSQNRKPSSSLTKLWDSFYERTGESVPLAAPERMILKTSAEYDSCDEIRRDISVICSGTAFLIKGGILATCRHCIRDVHEIVLSNKDTLVEVKQDGETICKKDVNEFIVCHQNDLAYFEAPELMRGLPGFELDFGYFPQPDEKVRAFGHADGDEEVRDIVATVRGYRLDKQIVEVDRPFIAGMSGGPVLNSCNRVIGYVIKGSKPGDYFHDGAFFLLCNLSASSLKAAYDALQNKRKTE